MKIKTAELDGAALAWVVNQIEGPQDSWANDEVQFARLLCEITATQEKFDVGALSAEMDLSTSEINELFERAHAKWEASKKDVPTLTAKQVQDIIEREKIELTLGACWWRANVEYTIDDALTPHQSQEEGPTAQTAAMRCFVFSRRGPEVEVPDYLFAHLIDQPGSHQEAASENQPIERPRG
jgi:hypothetical protein